MNAPVSLMDGLGLDGDRCICVIPQQRCAEGAQEVHRRYMGGVLEVCIRWEEGALEVHGRCTEDLQKVHRR